MARGQPSFDSENHKKCQVCGNEKIEFIHRIEAKRYAAGEYFNFFRCTACKLIFLNPRLDDTGLKNYYPDNYEPHDAAKARASGTRRFLMRAVRSYVYDVGSNNRWQERNIVRRTIQYVHDKLSYRSIPQYRFDGKILDIGCGIGSYLSVVKEIGWNEFGIETDQNASWYAKYKLGLQVQSGDFGKADFPDKFFDVITMWHSLEHFSKPKKIIEKVRRILKDDGMLMIGIPNYCSLDRRFFKESWNGLEIPLHLYHFTPESIRLLLERTGFKSIKIVHTIRPADISKSLRNFLLDKYQFNLNKYLDTIFSLSLIPASIIFSILKRSSIIKVFAK